MKKGMNFSDRCRFCREMGEKIEPFLCESCKQKIFDWLNEKGWTVITQSEIRKDIPIKEKD